MIWEVARAITAAPSISNSVAIGKQMYMDGAVSLGNMSRESINEILRFVDDGPKRLVYLISIGCGRPRKNSYGPMKQLSGKSSVKAMNLDSVAVHQQTDALAKLFKIPYYRFNFEGNRWERPRPRPGTHRSEILYDELEREVEDYFRDDKEAREMLAKCARDLVNRRRLRSFDDIRWRQYTDATT